MIELFRGNITTLVVDAIVNAANETLLGGCPTGEARLTAGYRLPASHVIHIACDKFWASEHAGVVTLHKGFVLDWYY